jgi:GntR family transcriptional regulator
MTQQWDPESPIYFQLYQQVIKRILDGFIAEGEPVPSVRNVASEYRLNPITISKAYQMLQDENIVEKQRGKGLFVKPGAKNLILERERNVFINKEWPVVMQQIERLQLKIEDLVAGSLAHIKEDK